MVECDSKKAAKRNKFVVDASESFAVAFDPFFRW
jgi:hypothetical protein